ncbi:hypothetical protein [Bremerella sp. P1]|uniref:hypothetical protein n=1 Tax=Bremerella sp. P1 TaxID=3026424 RepID=UPI002368200F|nr:hypothetical protein [Bremerella sp. P1]WDI44465.1 hypothetical protein PSR63_11025 [Bremerella sp. P1]
MKHFLGFRFRYASLLAAKQRPHLNRSTTECFSAGQDLEATHELLVRQIPSHEMHPEVVVRRLHCLVEIKIRIRTERFIKNIVPLSKPDSSRFIHRNPQRQSQME